MKKALKSVNVTVSFTGDEFDLIRLAAEPLDAADWAAKVLLRQARKAARPSNGQTNGKAKPKRKKARA